MATLTPGPFSSRRQLRITMAGALLIALASGVYDLSLLIANPGQRSWVSFASNLVLLAGLVVVLILVEADRLEAAAWAICGLTCAYALITIILFPSLLLNCVLIPLGGVMLGLSYVSSRTLQAQSLIAWLVIVLVTALSQTVPLAGAEPALSIEPLDLAFAIVLAGLLLLVLNLFHLRLHQTLAQLRTANYALGEARDALEQTVDARTAELQAALREVEARAAEQALLLSRNAEQRELIRSLAAPVLPINPTTLVMPLVGELDEARLRDVVSQALLAVERTGSRRLLLDITGVPMVDRPVARGLVEVVRAVRLMGAETILVGIRPEVAQAVVGLGLSLGGLRTAATLREGLELPQARPT